MPVTFGDPYCSGLLPRLNARAFRGRSAQLAIPTNTNNPMPNRRIISATEAESAGSSFTEAGREGSAAGDASNCELNGLPTDLLSGTVYSVSTSELAMPTPGIMTSMANATYLSSLIEVIMVPDSKTPSFLIKCWSVFCLLSTTRCPPFPITRMV